MREFDAVPLDVSASTEPWERYSRLFGEEIKVPSTKSRKEIRKSVIRLIRINLGEENGAGPIR